MRVGHGLRRLVQRPPGGRRPPLRPVLAPRGGRRQRQRRARRRADARAPRGEARATPTWPTTRSRRSPASASRRSSCSAAAAPPRPPTRRPSCGSSESFTGATVIVDPRAARSTRREGADQRIVKRNLEVVRGYADNERPAGGRTIVLRFRVVAASRCSAASRCRACASCATSSSTAARARPTTRRSSTAAWSSTPSATAASPSRASRSTSAPARSRTSSAASSRASTPRAGPSAARPGSSEPTRSAPTRPWTRCSRTSTRSPEPPRDRDHLAALLDAAGVVDYEGWERIDEHERAAGEAEDRPRIKLVDLADMLDVAR